MTSLRTRPFFKRYWGPGAGVLAVVQLFILWLLPYSTSVVLSGGGDTERPPDAQGSFQIGVLRWPVKDLASDPALSDFRAYFGRWCQGRSGLDAAICVSNQFAEQFPYGQPEGDLFSANYNPHATLIAHTVEGEPGHCVSRAGLAVAALLSAGIPARVVQIVFPTGAGHTLVSLWDERFGWVLFDTLFGGTLVKDGQLLKIPQIVDPSVPVTWEPLGKAAPGAPEEERRGIYRKEALAQATVLYPEPWVYLRSGAHVAYWPYRTVFQRIGASPWWIGPVQLVLALGTVIAALVFAAHVVATAVRTRPRSRT